ncbi:MAG: sulfotransferase [Deinococcales bacterium]
MSLITVIGRGHSGTRAISHTLYASGVYMGKTINNSGDLVPPEAMYDACRIFANYVDWQGEDKGDLTESLRWDFSRALAAEIPKDFTDLIYRYLETVLSAESDLKGWKIPETTLVYPWILKMFPEAKYIFWIRDPRDSILQKHKTDDLREFGIDYPRTKNIRLRRAISWKYQYDLVKATPKPKYWLELRFEDFVLKQEETLQKLEAFLGFKLGRIIVRPDAVERWKLDEGEHDFSFFEPAMKAYGYL